jgi:hypothetical protein
MGGSDSCEYICFSHYLGSHLAVRSRRFVTDHAPLLERCQRSMHMVSRRWGRSAEEMGASNGGFVGAYA